jgi:trehalose/maltose hydrolase-like predicted phosphorylase
MALFVQALESDVADVQGGTTAEGIHLGAMAGTVDIVPCLTGMRAAGDALRFDPALPPEVKNLRFSVHYRGHRVDVTLAEDRLSVTSRPGRASPIKILVRDETRVLEPGTRADFRLARKPPPGRRITVPAQQLTVGGTVTGPGWHGPAGPMPAG